MKIITFIFISLIMVSFNVEAIEYYCVATEKYDFGVVYDQEIITRFKYATKVEETKDSAYLSRCSMSSNKQKPEITCDRYKVDKIAYDKNMKIKKYYIFSSQLDFHIYPSMKSIENNGRGSVQYGECKIVSP